MMDCGQKIAFANYNNILDICRHSSTTVSKQTQKLQISSEHSHSCYWEFMYRYIDGVPPLSLPKYWGSQIFSFLRGHRHIAIIVEDLHSMRS